MHKKHRILTTCIKKPPHTNNLYKKPSHTNNSYEKLSYKPPNIHITPHHTKKKKLKETIYIKKPSHTNNLHKKTITY